MEVAVFKQSEISEREAEALILGSAPECEEKAKTLDELLDGSEVARTTAQRVVKRLSAEGKVTQSGRGKEGIRSGIFYRKRFLPKRQIYMGRKN